MGVKINVEGFKTKTLFNTASELFINKVRRCGEDYDHRGVCRADALNILFVNICVILL